MSPSYTPSTLLEKDFSKPKDNYKYFGVHKLKDGTNNHKYVFRVYAENASQVALLGDFNSWTNEFMVKDRHSDVWELIFESEIPIEGMRYKYRLFTDEGISYLQDPYAREFDVYPNHLAIVVEEKGFEWHDKKYMEARKKAFEKNNVGFSRAFNLYSSDLDAFLGEKKNYREIGAFYSEYLVKNGYTHIHLPSALKNGIFDTDFAPNPSYGSPEDFKCFIDLLHSADIGVILTLSKNTSPEAALYWIREFHIDGFCVSDAAETENKSEFSDVIFILDKKDGSKKDGQFLLKNFGWTKEMLDYLSTDPYFRAGKYNRLTFPLLYAFSYNYILTTDFEGESNKKLSLFSNMFGYDTSKFAGLRVFFTAMMTYPGKKLFCADKLFSKESVDLDTLFERINNVQIFYEFLSSLNHLYLENPALWENDFSKDGFEWVCNDRGGDSVIAYKRIAKDGKELIAVFNFSSVFRKKYKILITGKYVYYQEIFNSDAQRFGGKSRVNDKTITRLDGSVELDLPPVSAIIIQPIYL